MSEEILKALMQLFALIVKQDEGVESNEREYVENFLTQQLNDEAVPEYLALFDEMAGLTGDDKEEKTDKIKLTSVKDSVRILGICKKINKTLTQKQKVIVLVRLFELINADRKFSEQRMAIINTVAEVFKLTKEEFVSIESFVINNEVEKLDFSCNLIISEKKLDTKECKQVKVDALNGHILILQVKSVDLYFMRYTGQEDLFLNGLPVNYKRIYLFANGGTIKLPKGKPIYYSDIVAHYLADSTSIKISYTTQNVNFIFPNGGIGLRDINFSEDQGKLIGLMGASGAGKTTLLNVLAGISEPTSGEILINGINLHTEKEKLEGVIGYIPQDDLLIEELTVYQNLYYNAKLCFNDKSEEEINALVDKTLVNLGLHERKDLKVGSPLNKMISGGQRKRLNIALELIREPSILFVDEPTSGLSSRDSENVMDLLRELALKGKLIFVVIHQPSSDIYKMFDNMMILDTGGYMIYYGNPVEGVMYFKRLDAQINSEVGECPTCGNVNPELIFNIIEARVVDEYGKYTLQRKISPQKWEENFKENIKLSLVEPVVEPPPSTLRIPSWIKQLSIYTIRDFLSKISNKQYIALNLLEAPVLGFILSYIIRYIADPNSREYIFRENENIHIYIFMGLIVALFLGLTISAEEIFRDRKILKREAFLNLSRSSYLISKIFILFSISAIQALLFVLIANNILGVRGMFFEYWFALFTTAAFANMMGLNVSASFNSAVTIYILIPLLMIPMMILSGAMFPFDKMNRSIGSVKKVPWVAEFMPTKWSFEALMVNQFKNNEFQKNFYDIEKRESNADFKQVYYLPELSKQLTYIEDNWYRFNEPDVKVQVTDALALLKNELNKEQDRTGIFFESAHQLDTSVFNEIVLGKTSDYLNKLESYYSTIFQKANNEKENKIRYLLKTQPELYRAKRDAYHNESVEDQVKKVFEKNKILRYKDELVQQIDPVYKDPDIEGFLNFRSHFFAPQKYFLGQYRDTYWFNMIFIWVMTLFFYVTLYYEVLKKVLTLPEYIKLRK
ncbi:MAG: ABC transporter [Bacteroidetes bacterium GWC2_33_15]|nr:MAG: ABC transporter [Bacteroidetes bacterium GWA2_33_15]OFX48991.1 MAG: ABC transporter [Bacteroidetes bacterium GWC2_33_15]OFX64745.1 MAG: ABC transporter [Bacteroidetes bacterium GWB2_32_14]OFX68447.1 MAG: ABC transporter [Bacteroidetes bacterium GWD2_33_33]HAN19170.1 ABC transporter [Bacteroidales bacterium]